MTPCDYCGHAASWHTPAHGCHHAATFSYGTVACDCTTYAHPPCNTCNGFGCADCYEEA